jgi:hypothetical protein
MGPVTGPHALPAGQMNWPDAVVRDAGIVADGTGDAGHLPIDPVGVRARYSMWGRADSSADAGSLPRSPARSQAVALLGLVAAAKQTAFCHHARDAAASDRVAIRVTMADIAAAEQDRCALARRRLGGLGVDPLAEMTPYLRELSSFDYGQRTEHWWERVVSSYLSHGIAVDTQRILAVHLDPSTAGLFAGLLEECAGADYLRALLVHAVRADSRRAARLSLWGRRVAGDAIGVATRTVARVAGLGEILASGSDGGVAPLQSQLIAEHARRMDALGLTP